MSHGQQNFMQHQLPTTQLAAETQQSIAFQAPPPHVLASQQPAPSPHQLAAQQQLQQQPFLQQQLHQQQLHHQQLHHQQFHQQNHHFLQPNNLSHFQPPHFPVPILPSNFANIHHVNSIPIVYHPLHPQPHPHAHSSIFPQSMHSFQHPRPLISPPLVNPSFISSKGDISSAPTTQLPITRVKKIMKEDGGKVSQDAVVSVSFATELFLEYLIQHAHMYTKREKRKTVLYRDIAHAVRDIEQLEFLSDIIPLTHHLPKELSDEHLDHEKENSDAANEESRMEDAINDDLNDEDEHDNDVEDENGVVEHVSLADS